MRVAVGVLSFLCLVSVGHAVPNQALQREFKKTWDLERKALEHQSAVALRQHRTAQKAQSKEWRNKERSERHAFFAAHMSGKERREYVQNYLERKEKFEKAQEQGSLDLSQDWATKRKLFKERRMNAEIQFNAAVLEKRDPPIEVWPAGKAPSPANNSPEQQPNAEPSPGTP